MYVSVCVCLSVCLSVCPSVRPSVYLPVFHLAFIARVITEWTYSKHKRTTTTNNNTSLFLLGINHANLIQNYLQPITYHIQPAIPCSRQQRKLQNNM